MNPAEQLEFWREKQALIQNLLADVTKCLDLVNAERTQFARRNFVRALFAAVEGITWALKQTALMHHALGYVPLSPGEQAMLAEVSPDIDDKGQVTERQAHIALKHNVRFALQTFAKTEGLTFILSVSDDGWESFQKSIRIRDRLMHPKNANDLTVSDEETGILDRASGWWATQLGDLLKRVMSEGISKQRGAQFPRPAT